MALDGAMGALRATLGLLGRALSLKNCPQGGRLYDATSDAVFPAACWLGADTVQGSGAIANLSHWKDW
jgi:hypothetical protein